MCDICNGMSYDESRSRALDTIERVGWMIQYVEPPAHGVGWAYTIGLVEHFGHPELAIVDCKVATIARVLNGAAADIAGGNALVPGDRATADRLAGADASVHPVHPAHLTGETFARWHDIYRTWPAPPRLEAIELVLGDSWYCECHRGRGPSLSGRHLAAPGLNRADRRAAARATRRRRPGPRR